MKKLMKILLRTASVAVLLVAMVFPTNFALASEVKENCDTRCNHDHNIGNDDNLLAEYKQNKIDDDREEIIVEVKSEEEYLNYPVDPKYKYTFIITQPSPSKSLCSRCLRPNMTLVSTVNEDSRVPRRCPIQQEGVDHYITDKCISYEKCYSCGYQSSS